MTHLAVAWESRPACRQRSTGPCCCEAVKSGIDGSLGNPWLDRLPGVVAGVLFRQKLARYFQEILGGEVLTYAEDPQLHVHLLKAQTPSPRQDTAQGQGCVVFLHGGGFLGGAPSQFYPYVRLVTQRFGVAAACCEFRTLLSHPLSRVPFDAVADARRCVTFLQDRAEGLGLDATKIVLAGASSGGHTAAVAALDAGAGRESTKETSTLRPGLGLAALVLFNPVLDLKFEENWAERRSTVWIGSAVLRLLFGSRELEAYSPLRRIRLGQLERVSYPTLIMHGTADHLVPLAEVVDFQKEMRRQNNACEVVTFKDEGHFFFNWRVSQSNFSRCVGLLGDLLSSVGMWDGQVPHN